jgi:hypothetical protein
LSQGHTQILNWWAKLLRLLFMFLLNYLPRWHKWHMDREKH